jgi:pilus assembly protein CpaB
MISAKSRRWPHGIALQRSAIRLLLAGGLAVLALVMTQMWMESSSRASGPVASIEVLVTARAIDAGSVIDSADLRWQRWPAGLVGADWLVPPVGPRRLVGRVAAMPVAAGVPVTEAMTLARGAGSSFAATIPPGLRAITLAVTPAGGLAGFVEPGDRVDVLLTQAIGNRRTAQTLIADLGVLGVDQRRRGGSSPVEAASDVIAEAAIDGEATPPGLVTLEVTPRQAEALAVAGEMGKLSLVLRGPSGGRSGGGRRWDSDVTGLSVAQLAAGAALPALPVAPAIPVAAPVVERGGVEIVYGVGAPEAAPAVTK